MRREHEGDEARADRRQPGPADQAERTAQRKGARGKGCGAQRDAVHRQRGNGGVQAGVGHIADGPALLRHERLGAALGDQGPGCQRAVAEHQVLPCLVRPGPDAVGGHHDRQVRSADLVPVDGLTQEDAAQLLQVEGAHRVARVHDRHHFVVADDVGLELHAALRRMALQPGVDRRRGHRDLVGSVDDRANAANRAAAADVDGDMRMLLHECFARQLQHTDQRARAAQVDRRGDRRHALHGVRCRAVGAVVKAGCMELTALEPTLCSPDRSKAAVFKRSRACVGHRSDRRLRDGNGLSVACSALIRERYGIAQPDIGSRQGSQNTAIERTGAGQRQSRQPAQEEQSDSVL